MNCLYCNSPLNIENGHFNVYSCNHCEHKPWFAVSGQAITSISFYVNDFYGIHQNLPGRELIIFYPDSNDFANSLDIAIPFDHLCRPEEVIPLLEKILKLKAFI